MSNSTQQTAQNTTIFNCSVETYRALPNHIAEDVRISWAAKGLLWYLLSRPSDWKVHPWQLSKIYQGEKRGNGIEAIWSILLELRIAGYVIYCKSRELNGQWKHEYKVYNMPISEEIQKKIPHRVKPGVVKPDVVKPGILQNKELPNNELPNGSVMSSPPSKVKKSHVFKAKDYKGLDVSLIIDELFHYAVKNRMNWETAEIEEAFQILLHDYPDKKVSDPIALITKIINNKRAMKKSEQKRENKHKNTKDKSWKKNAMQHSKHEKMQSDTIKKNGSEKITLGQASPEYLRMVKLLTS